LGRLEGKIALITGAGKGIGKAIALAFAREGADVIVNDIDSENAQKVAEEIRKSGVRFKAIIADVANEAEVDRTVTEALRAFGRIDILVNNAGIAGPATGLADMPVTEWDRVIAVDLRSVFLCTKFVLPSMLKHKYGKIINIASQLGQRGEAGLVAYCAAKAGVIGFTKALARELAPYINVNAIGPGPVDTDLTRSIGEEGIRPIISRLPMKRIGTVDDIAPTAVFLASEDSKWYTGQTLGPNGGDVML